MQNIINAIEEQIMQMKQACRYDHEECGRIMSRINEKEGYIKQLQQELETLKNKAHRLYDDNPTSKEGHTLRPKADDILNRV